MSLLVEQLEIRSIFPQQNYAPVRVSFAPISKISMILYYSSNLLAFILCHFIFVSPLDGRGVQRIRIRYDLRMYVDLNFKAQICRSA